MTRDEELAMLELRAMSTRVEISGEPRSKGRVRFTKQGWAYSPAAMRKYEEHLRTFLRPAFPQPLSTCVAIEMEFYRSTKHRVDLDNLAKMVLDAANGICWLDDQQVTRITACLELAPKAPRTVIVIAATESTMPRGGDIADCPACGRRYFKRTGRGILARYCSDACGRKHHALGTCAICKAPLQRRGALLCKQCWLQKAKKGRSKNALAKQVTLRGKRPASSKRRGISQRRDTGKWAAYSTYDGRRITLGSFPTEAEAIAALDKFESVGDD